jgi:hypothetical protein
MGRLSRNVLPDGTAFTPSSADHDLIQKTPGRLKEQDRSLRRKRVPQANRDAFGSGGGSATMAGWHGYTWPVAEE